MDKTFEKRKKMIYDFISDDLYTPMKFKERAILLQVPKEEKDELRQVLGMLEGTRIVVVNRKKRGAMIVKIRGTRFAMGQSITRHIEVKEV